MPPRHFARLVEPRRPAQPQDPAGELVEPFGGIHVARRARPALLIVHDKRRSVILIGGESSEVPAVAQKRLQRLVRGRLIARILRPPLLLHEMDHHVTGRRVDNVGGSGPGVVLVPVKNHLAVFFPVSVGV